MREQIRQQQEEETKDDGSSPNRKKPKGQQIPDQSSLVNAITGKAMGQPYAEPLSPLEFQEQDADKVDKVI